MRSCIVPATGASGDRDQSLVRRDLLRAKTKWLISEGKKLTGELVSSNPSHKKIVRKPSRSAALGRMLRTKPSLRVGASHRGSPVSYFLTSL